LANRSQQARQVIQKGLMMGTGGVGLFFEGSLHPPLDENPGVSLDQQADL
jgi:hypothetical protein